jgi:hypothetical protein
MRMIRSQFLIPRRRRTNPKRRKNRRRKIYANRQLMPRLRENLRKLQRRVGRRNSTRSRKIS